MRYKLVMGNQAYSSWSMRGWLLLKPFGIDFDSEVVQLYVPGYRTFLEEYYPASTVPALRVADGDSQYTLWDSLAIAEFLHERHPQAGIWPAGAEARAAARCLCAEMHSSYAALRNAMPMNVRREYRSITADDETRRDIERIEVLWDWTASRWGGQGPYLFGADFTAAEAFYAPVASRFKTYNVKLSDASQRYANALLEHPATIEFYEAGRREPWVMEQNEFDAD
ncbi:MAG: glutathione S-transferase [Gammaproteobacteria bacterium]|jgi:glutathione S-transferase